ncbi:YdbC family protein [Microbacteriaceae bacterium 4G12]
MIIKKITCKVTENQKEIFYEHQKQWKPLSKAKGFLGQVGGWSIKQPLTACIFSFWESQTAYQRFMEEQHDQIFVNSGQESSYESINVSLYEEELRIPGLVADIVPVLKMSNYIRIAVSQVKEHSIDHFVDMQKNVWNVGMQKSEGMLGGVFACSQKQKNEFLTFTGWKNEVYHQNYVEQHLPELLKVAQPKSDVWELTGDQFKVEEAWRVCPISD